jgi:hypothetical protein
MTTRRCTTCLASGDKPGRYHCTTCGRTIPLIGTISGNGVVKMFEPEEIRYVAAPEFLPQPEPETNANTAQRR